MIVTFGFPNTNLAEETRAKLIQLKGMPDPGTSFSQGRNCKEFFTLKKVKTPKTFGRQQIISVRANTLWP